jgi:hypothetical protein
MSGTWKITDTKENSGKSFEPEGKVISLLVELDKGNILAKHAVNTEGYTLEDAPFWVGCVDGQHFIYAEKHLNKNYKEDD